MKSGGNAPSFFVENVLQILAILMLFAGITVSILCLFVIDDKDVDALSWSRYYDVFVIGGAMFYKTMVPYCEEVYVTKVDADGEATVFYPNLDEMDNFSEVYSSEPIESNGYTIRFTTYKNSNPLKF